MSATDIVGAIFGDDEVRVNCAAANLNIANGVARPQILPFNTKNALINITGTASFASEQLDLTIHPKVKGFASSRCVRRCMSWDV
ncbi:hypothetical protein ACLK2A_19115 [Escherichia coli]